MACSDLQYCTVFLVMVVFFCQASGHQLQKSDPSWQDDIQQLQEASKVGTIVKRSTSDENKPDIANKVIAHLLKDYDSNRVPDLEKSTQVRIGIYINNFERISESLSEMKVGSMYLRQSWLDERLKFDYDTIASWEDSELEDITEDDVPNSIMFPASLVTKIFLPDTFFRNEKGHSMDFDDIDLSNTLLRVNQTGHVWFVRKVGPSFACHMKLQKYPMDTQMCGIFFESFKYKTDQMYFNWLDSPVDVNPLVHLPHFTLEDIILFDCGANYTAGSFPCLEIRFILRRDFGYALLQIYLPSILVVMLSWTAFWTKMESGYQVGLEIILILTIMIMVNNSTQSLPQISYIRALDVWYFACIIMICGALLDIIIVNLRSGGLRGKQWLGKLKLKLRGKQDEESGTKEDKQEEADEAATKNEHKIARILFPVLFLVFNIIYWALYTAPAY